MNLHQSLFAYHLVHAPYKLGEPTLDSLQYVHIFLVLGSPKLDPALQMWPHKCCVDGNNHFFQLAVITLNCHHKTRSCLFLTFSFT